MLNPWLALEIGADPVQRAARLREAHARFITDGDTSTPTLVRDVVADSWRRSLGAHVDPDGLAPVDMADPVLSAYRAAHPLAAAMPVLRELLGTVADDGEHVLAVSDAHGRLLWVEGHTGVLRKAEAMNFVPGASWDEAHAGTNAPGTALATDHAVQIFAAEHFSTLVQRWTCAAAPIHDPRSGRLLGAVDLTGRDHLASPQSLALVQAAARAVEAHLAGVLPLQTLSTPGVLGESPDGIHPARSARVEALGRDEALLALPLPEHTLRLSRRHSEIVALLADRPDGLTGEQLCLELYGDCTISPVTLRAELSRLRRLLGPQLLDSRPYRLRVPVLADFLDVGRALESGSTAVAVHGYRGPLLPGSDAPGVVRLRNRLENQIRAALLSGRDALLLARWTQTPWGADDLQAWEALLGVCTSTSPRRPLIAARVDELRHEYAPALAPTDRAARDPRATWLQRRHL